jgi:hypothetical protein
MGDDLEKKNYVGMQFLNVEMTNISNPVKE